MVRRFSKWLTLVFVLVVSTSSFAMTVFSEDFETGLSSWQGKGASTLSPHHGLILFGPLDTDYSLGFWQTAIGGDLFTQGTFSSAANMFRLDFDYLGTCGHSNCGGFIGFSYNTSPGNDATFDGVGDHVWLAGTDGSYAVNSLSNSGSWQPYSFVFTTDGSPIHLMLEDFSFSPDGAFNAFFDNIVLTAVPLPPAVWLFGSSLIALIAVARRRTRLTA